jgi:hypothetical protein
MSWRPHPSKSRIEAMIKAARLASGISVADILGCRSRDATRVRHGIWRELYAQGFGYTGIAKAWGADHTTIIAAVRGLPGKPALIDREAA